MKRFSSTTLLLLLALAAMPNVAEAFVKGCATSRTRPLTIELNMAPAAKGKAKAKKAKAKAKAPSTVESVRKPEFIAAVAEKMDCNKAEADLAVAAVLDTIQENVVDGKKVSLPGFGTFQLRARAARKGRNPQTGEPIDIKASNSPGFTAAKAFKEAANE